LLKLTQLFALSALDTCTSIVEQCSKSKSSSSLLVGGACCEQLLFIVGPMKRLAAESEQLGALKHSESRCNTMFIKAFQAADRVNWDSCPIFSNPDLRKLMFEYVGGRQWLVMGAVCKRWQLFYKLLCFQRQARLRSALNAKSGVPITYAHIERHDSRKTAYSAVFAAVPMLQMAANSGVLQLDRREAQFNAGRHGIQSTLAAAHTLGMPWSEHVVEGAVTSGCVSQLQWVQAQRCVPLPAGVAELAAENGSVPMLAHLQQEGVAFTARTSAKAAKSGHLPALQFLHSLACPIDWHAGDAAAERGDLPMLKFLHGAGLTVHRGLVLESAASGGSVEVMAWLLEGGAELSSDLLLRPAMHSHLQFCQYLHDQGCPWAAKSTDFLLTHKLLRPLEWALSQGVAFTAEQQQRFNKLMAEELTGKAEV
jgi:hypothetical protein